LPLNENNIKREEEKLTRWSRPAIHR
jgi:hypothetical protein